MSNFFGSNQAFLFLGSQESVESLIVQKIQEEICLNFFCKECYLCKSIQNKKSQFTLWIEPKDRYKKDDIDYIFEKTSLQLCDDQKFFFIITQAEKLSLTCSNSLLKLIEEPPLGYYFLFCSFNLNSVISTIKSRCNLIICDSDEGIKYNEFVNLISKQNDVLIFSKLVQDSSMTEHECLQLISQLIKIVNSKIESENKIKQSDIKLYNLLDVLIKRFNCEPQIGSSKIYLRQLYFDFTEYINYFK